MGVKVDRTIRIDAYAVLSRAVEEGVAYGWNRAHKHVDTPEPDCIKDQIETAVMSAICEVIKWEDER